MQIRWRPQFYSDPLQPAWRGYALALAFTALALLVRFALTPVIGDVQPFAFFYLSVAFTAWFAGFGPAVLAFFAGLGAGTLFLEPQFSLGLPTLLRMATYTAVSGCFGVLLFFARQSEWSAIENARRIQAAKEELHQKNAIFEGLAESVIDAILIVSHQGGMLYANQQFTQMWKFPAEVLASGSDEAALSWAATQVADPVAFREGVASAYSRSDRPVRGEVLMKDGRVYDRYGAPVTYDGVNYAWVWTFRDITERKKADESLKSSEQMHRQLAEALQAERNKLTAVIDNLPVGVGVGDTTGTTHSLNKAGLQLHGFSSEEELFSRLEDYTREFELRYLDGTLIPIEQWPVSRAMRGEFVRDFELRLHNKNANSERILSFSVVPVPNQREQTNLLVYVMQDLTEGKRTEKELRSALSLIDGITKGTEDLIAAEDSQFRFIYFNDAYRREFKKLWGQEIEVGTSMMEALAPWPQQQQNALQLWKRALDGESFSVTAEFGNENEKQVYDLHFNPVYDTEGKSIGAAHFLRNVTSRVRAQEALREAKEQAERSRAEQLAIVNSMTEAVAIFDEHGNLLDMNPAGLAMHGLESLDQLRSHNSKLEQLFELRELNGNKLPADMWPVARILAGESLYSYELRVSKIVGGKSFIGSFGGAPVRDSTRRIVHAVVTVRDVTAQREAERALADANTQLERHTLNLERAVADRTARLTETVRELEAFSYSLSHDLRSPLRAMRGFSQILLDEHSSKLGSEGKLYLTRIATAAGRLDQLILDVLNYSRVVQENVDLRPIDVECLTRQLIDENPSLQPPRAEISIQSPLHTVLAHEAYMMQVLSNLVYNAVKFVAPGQVPRVRIWTEPNGSEVRLCIQDNGIGIPKEAQQRMFGMFQRYHAEHIYEGTGIGLAIVCKAVERMKGRVGIKSDPGAGSTFWVELPRPERNSAG
jgi:PAS domain S-box-containing protein